MHREPHRAASETLVSEIHRELKVLHRAVAREGGEATTETLSRIKQIVVNARIEVEEARRHLASGSGLELVVFAVFGADALEAFERALAE